MTSTQIEVFINSRNPKTAGRQYMALQYGDEIGGLITTDVKLIGDVYIPITSWATGKCIFKDVKLPYNTQIISLNVHEGQQIGQIGDFELVREFRVLRGVYVSGLLRKADHDNLNAHVIIGYDLKFIGRTHLTMNRYKETQKQKDKKK